MADALAALPPVPEERVADAAALDRLLADATEPFVIRGLVADWPLVRAAKRSGRAARDYLLALRRDVPFTASVGSGLVTVGSSTTRRCR